MRSCRWGAGAILAAIALAGCGSNHKTASTAASTASTPGAPTSPAAIPPGAPPAIREVAGRVLIAGDIPGMAPKGRRTLGINASSWLAEEGLPAFEREKELRRLERLGFVRAVRERLTPSSEAGPEAISVVIKFRSSRAALTNVQEEVTMGKAHGAKAFAVAGIPGAKGFGGVFHGTTVGYNVTFASGDYYYLVGEGYATGTPGAPTRQELITAAQRLYSRVHR